MIDTAVCQWLPLHALKEPFRSRLLACFDDVVPTLSPPRQFALSNSVTTPHGTLLWVSSQVPHVAGSMSHPGVIGREIDLAQARAATRLALRNLLCIIGAACGGDLARVSKFVRLTGHLRSTADFADHEHVLDAASEVLNTVFDARGRHARSVIGVSSLPDQACVALECIVQLNTELPSVAVPT